MKTIGEFLESPRRVSRAIHARGRLALARRFPRFGDYWELRMRLDARRGETDMWSARGESFYAQLYLDRIRDLLAAHRKLRILDAGCQAGRFAIPLAKAGHVVTGIDISRSWIEHCRRHSQAEGVRLELVCNDLRQAVENWESGSFDAVLCTELLYTRRDLAELLQAFHRILVNGGLLISSHRTRYYFLLTLARYRRFAEMAMVLKHSEGEILGSYFNWFHEQELRRIYTACGFAVMDVHGIGTVSGIGPDGLAAILDPTSLADREREELLRIERECALPYRELGRYLLVVAERSEAGKP